MLRPTALTLHQGRLIRPSRLSKKSLGFRNCSFDFVDRLLQAKESIHEITRNGIRISTPGRAVLPLLREADKSAF
jgi:hypothetical protein